MTESGSQGGHDDLRSWGQIWGANRRGYGTGTEIRRKKEKSGRGTEIGHSDAKIYVYDNTIKIAAKNTRT